MEMNSTSPWKLYVGSYTPGPDSSQGIICYQLDPQAQKITPLSSTASQNPSFLAMHPSRQFLYAVNEITEFGSPPDCAISAFSISNDGNLRLLNQQPSLGNAPCFLDIDPTGTQLVSANYYGGNFVRYPIEPDGRLAHPASQTQPKTNASHAHCIRFVPNSPYALACNLGLEQVLVYRVEDGNLNHHNHVQLEPNTGPRHLEQHPTHPWVYTVNENGNSITAFHWDASTGSLQRIQAISTLPADYAGTCYASDLHIHPNGNFLYASNREQDSIAVYQINLQTGQLQLLQHQPSLGRWPRYFCISPDGSLLVAANQKSDSLAIFRIHPQTGLLTPLFTHPSPTPTFALIINT